MTVLSAKNIFNLDNRMGKVAKDAQLGTMLEQALNGTVPTGSISTAELADLAVTLAKLAAGITPSHVVKYAGKHTTLGGDATEVITVTGLLTTDVVHVTVQTAGGTPRSIVASVLTANTITVTMSGDPSTDHILAYSVLRAAA